MLDALGVLQHHDAITGTENQHTANIYGEMAYEALVSSDLVYGKELQRKLKKYTGITSETLVPCVGS